MYYINTLACFPDKCPCGALMDGALLRKIKVSAFSGEEKMPRLVNPSCTTPLILKGITNNAAQ